MDEHAIKCPHCNGEPTLLGRLGQLLWFRCRYCGTDFSTGEASLT